MSLERVESWHHGVNGVPVWGENLAWWNKVGFFYHSFKPCVYYYYFAVSEWVTFVFEVQVKTWFQSRGIDSLVLRHGLFPVSPVYKSVHSSLHFTAYKTFLCSCLGVLSFGWTSMLEMDRNTMLVQDPCEFFCNISSVGDWDVLGHSFFSWSILSLFHISCVYLSLRSPFPF